MGVPNTFVDGTVASASEVNANFTNVENYLGYAEIDTTDFNTTTTPTDVDVTNLAVTVTVPSGARKIKITVFTADFYTNAAAATDLYLKIKEDTTVLILGRARTAQINEVTTMTVVYVGTATAGSHTYKVAIAQSAAGTMHIAANGKAFILVEQI